MSDTRDNRPTGLVHKKMFEQVRAERDEAIKALGEEARARGLAEAEIDRLRDLLRDKDAELMTARHRADEKVALCREVEELLGVAAGPAGDEQFEHGVARLRTVIAENKRMRAAIESNVLATDAAEAEAAMLREILVRLVQEANTAFDTMSGVRDAARGCRSTKEEG